MYGVIIGDVAGSYYEMIEGSAHRNGDKPSYQDRIKILDKKVKLFNEYSTITDDTVLSYAVIKKLLDGGSYEDRYRYYGEKELNIGFSQRGIPAFGDMFTDWIKRNSVGESMNSYGNGASMRVAPIAYHFDNIDLILKEITESSKPTHNNDEAIRCAQMVGTAIYLARKGHSITEIKEYLSTKYSYQLDYSLEDLQRNYTFMTRSKDSVPVAIAIFLQSTDFEDAIRKAISVGGDSDTIASICGALGEAYYGIPEFLIKEVQKYIPSYMHEKIKEFYGQEGIKLEEKL